jgi:2-polyprenyl-6-methoxyphenol hydroxylase-like FAD-dependent oxidoreductase
MTLKRVLIVGGGPGGLVTALALRRAGIEALVIERAPGHRVLGAGVSLWPNAMKLLRHWGMGPAVEARGAVAGDTVLATVDASRLEDRFGAPLVVIHCASLQTVLRTALDSDTLHLGADCIGLDQDAHGVSVILRDGRRHQADLVIGADGAHSTVRATVVDDSPPRYGGITAWRGVVPLDRRSADALLTGEWWGSGAVFGVARLGANQAYWWATVRCDGTKGGTPDDEKADLMRRFGRWYPAIPALIDASVPDAITRTPLGYRPAAARRTAGRIALLGDAADLSSPSLGQGACQAIEDAAAVADSLVTEADEALALERYGNVRQRHLQVVVRRARRLSRLGHLANPVATALRNAMLPAAARNAVGWLAPVVGHEPPLL